MNGFIKINTIYGNAGTGKSNHLATTIVKTIRDNISCIVLASTHSALNNIYTIVKSKGGPQTMDLFKTIYAFFRIDYESNTIGGAPYIPRVIFIDEFSLVHKQLFSGIIRDINNRATSPVDIVLAGDPLQLNAIYHDKQMISLNKLYRYNKLSTNPLHISVIDHLHLSVFGMKRVLNGTLTKLSKNYRASSIVTQTLNAIYSGNKDFDYRFIDDITLIKHLLSNSGTDTAYDYTFIAPRYEILQRIHSEMGKRIREQALLHPYNDQPVQIIQGTCTGYSFKDLTLRTNDRVMLTKTSKERVNGRPLYYNGEVLTFVSHSETNLLCRNSNGVLVNVVKDYDDEDIHKSTPFYPVIPYYMMSIHKSQGRTLKNVVIGIDNMFDISMLYTAITRASENVYFYTETTDGVSTLMSAARYDEFRQLMKVIGNINKS